MPSTVSLSSSSVSTTHTDSNKLPLRVQAESPSPKKRSRSSAVTDENAPAKRSKSNAENADLLNTILPTQKLHSVVSKPTRRPLAPLQPHPVVSAKPLSPVKPPTLSKASKPAAKPTPKATSPIKKPASLKRLVIPSVDSVTFRPPEFSVAEEQPVADKKKSRPALQAIHIRALEHGLRVPVRNTPLGVRDQAENIIFSPAPMNLNDQPLMSAPAVLTERVLRPSASGVSKRGSVSADSSPVVPRRLNRRNTISSGSKSALVFEI
ncbi:hypothetical protein GGI07_001610 [Coemansia sp. Benny D115]|nr:hypothetical protein GGI07_001610 [Coemansia sp. Benny D115]